MKLQELLKANGIGDDVIEAIIAGMKENKIYTANEANLDIRYGKLKGDYESLTNQHSEAQRLIEELKQSALGSDALQGEINAYKTQIAELQKELGSTRLDSAIKVALLEAKANDIDYMTFKLKEKGELALDENGKIKGWDDKIAGLKTQFPTHFVAGNSKKVEPYKLPDTVTSEGGLTKKDILNKSYAERAQLFNENPEAYNAAMKG